MAIYPELTLQNQPGDADYIAASLGAYFNQKREDAKEQSKYEALIAQAAAQQGANVTKAKGGKGNMGAWNISPKSEKLTASDIKAMREVQYKDRDDRINRIWEAFQKTDEFYSMSKENQRKYYDNLVAETDAMYVPSTNDQTTETPGVANPAPTAKTPKDLKAMFAADPNKALAGQAALLALANPAVRSKLGKLPGAAKNALLRPLVNEKNLSASAAKAFAKSGARAVNNPFGSQIAKQMIAKTPVQAVGRAVAGYSSPLGAAFAGNMVGNAAYSLADMNPSVHQFNQSLGQGMAQMPRWARRAASPWFGIGADQSMYQD